VIHNKLKSFIASSNPSHWHETLAVLCTYGQPEEFPFLCQALGDHLLNANDLPNASLCYMCAFNLEKASQYWIKQLEEVFNIDERVGFLALHTFVEKVSVFMKALEPNYSLQDIVTDLFFQYAKVLADQGLFSIAAKYCRSDSQECKELRDRLYRSKDSHFCALAFGAPPEFPFDFCNVGVTPSVPTVTQAYTNNITYETQSDNKFEVTNNVKQCRNRTYENSYSYSIAQQHIPDSPKDLNMHANQGNCTEHLPPDWVAFQDPSSGKIYYANHSTGETTWDMPSSIVLNVSSTPNHYYKNSGIGTSQ
jgi:protein transport protein SEC31